MGMPSMGRAQQHHRLVQLCFNFRICIGVHNCETYGKYMHVSINRPSMNAFIGQSPLSALFQRSQKKRGYHYTLSRLFKNNKCCIYSQMVQLAGWELISKADGANPKIIMACKITAAPCSGNCLWWPGSPIVPAPLLYCRNDLPSP